MFKFLRKTISAIKKTVCNRTFAATFLALATTVTMLTSAAAVNTVTIVDGSEAYTIKTMTTDPRRVLDQAGIGYKEHDEAFYESLGTGRGMVTLRRAFDVTLTYGNDRYVAKVTGGTVADALSSVGITTNEHDILSASLNTAVYAGMFVDILSVNYETETAQEIIEPGVDTIYSDELAAGETSYTEGSAGIKNVTYNKRIVNGTLTETSAIAEEVVADAVNAVNIVGTKQNGFVGSVSGGTGTGNSAGAKYYSSVNAVSTLSPDYDIALDENNRPVSYSKCITGRATAYYGGYRTATGKVPQPGYVAVNPKQIPYGTSLYIITSDGSMIYGYASAQDTGGFINYGKTLIDLYFNSYGACVNFGARQVEVYVLD